jgi:tetratricopeptide (TPR) repeat protein
LHGKTLDNTHIHLTYDDVCRVEAWAKESVGSSMIEAQITIAVGAACRRFGHWDQAVMRYRKAVELEPESLLNRLHLAGVLGRSGKESLAVETWEEIIIGHYDQILSDNDSKEDNIDLILDHFRTLVHECHLRLKQFERTKQRYTALLRIRWRKHLELARALVENDEMEEAAEVLHELLGNNEKRFGDQEDYNLTRWNEALPLLAQVLGHSKRYKEAEAIYQQLVDEAMSRDMFEVFAKQAVRDSIFLFVEQEKFTEVINLLRRLENRRDSDGTSWLTVVFHWLARAISLHEGILMAARRSGACQYMVEMYRAAIEWTRRQQHEESTTRLLQYSLAVVLYSKGNSGDQRAAIELWQPLTELLKNDNSDYDGDDGITWVVQFRSVERLATTLFDLVRSGKREHQAALEKLAQDDPTDEHHGFKRSTLMLARLYQLTGKSTEARNLLRSGVEKAFATLEAEDAYSWLCLKSAFQATDDDVNASAVWQTFMPLKAPQQDSYDDCSNSVSQEILPPDTTVEFVAKPVPEQPAIPEQDGQQGAKGDASQPSNCESTDPLIKANVVALTGGNEARSEGLPTDTLESNAEHFTQNLEGRMSSYCDGRCGTTWTYVGEVDPLRSCKDCLDVQFCAECYGKLKDGTLVPVICSPDHTHMLLPSFDRQRWETTPEGHMWVDNSLVPMETWVEQVKRDWKVDKESLERRKRRVQSARKIQMAWRMYAWLAKEKKDSAPNVVGSMVHSYSLSQT